MLTMKVLAFFLWGGFLICQSVSKSLKTFHFNKKRLPTNWGSSEPPLTLILELGFNMMYLMEPWMFSVQETSQVTLLSCRTSFHLCPGGGEGTLASLWK